MLALLILGLVLLIGGGFALGYMIKNLAQTHDGFIAALSVAGIVLSLVASALGAFILVRLFL